MHDFAPWMAGFPGLLFSVDIPRSRLFVHNRWDGQEFDAPRLLKDALSYLHFARQLLS